MLPHTSNMMDIVVVRLGLAAASLFGISVWVAVIVFRRHAVARTSLYPRTPSEEICSAAVHPITRTTAQGSTAAAPTQALASAATTEPASVKPVANESRPDAVVAPPAGTLSFGGDSQAMNGLRQRDSWAGGRDGRTGQEPASPAWRRGCPFTVKWASLADSRRREPGHTMPQSLDRPRPGHERCVYPCSRPSTPEI